MGEPSITLFRGDTSRLKNKVPVTGRFTAEFHERERQKIFARAWLPVASALDVPQKGSYIAVDVPPMKTSLIIVRGDDGVVRAFHNVCRHRGDKLVHPAQGQGCKRAFVCGFHGWTYSNQGKLVGMTDQTQFVGIDREKHGLVQVHAEEWESLVFVNFEKQPSETLQEWLGDFHRQYAGFARGREKIADHRVILKTNWNIAVNAFCEGYHNLYIHRNTVPDYQGGSGNPNRHRPYIEVGRHFGRYSAHANFDHKQTPAEAVIYKHARRLFPSFPKLADPEALPAGINPSRFPQWAFDIVHIFPNFVLGPQANTHSHMWFWPIDHEHTEIRVVRFAYEAKTPADRVAHAYSKVRGREVLREDLATMEAALEAMQSGALPHIVLSQQEMLIQNHYRAVDDMLARN
jgi:phenylpropionate dioxygenase-like ring-hydroxylating dioxygenase large terminal subunit